MPVKVELANEPFQLFDFTLAPEDPPVSFFVWWNAFDSSWYLSLRTQSGVLFGMRRMTQGNWLMPNRTRFNGGDLYVFGASDPRTIDAWNAANSLLWYEGFELEDD